MRARTNSTAQMTSGFSDRFFAGQELPVYVVRAFNDAAESENKIHDDAVAKQYGFRGGLVPGVTVHAYMTHPVVEVLGLPWLDHGRMSARFLKPVYEGEETAISTKVARAWKDGIELELAVHDPSGELCAIGTVALEQPAAAPAAGAGAGAGAVAAREHTGERPPANEQSLAIGTVLGTLRETFRQAPDHVTYLAQIGEGLDLYRGPGAVAHPGWLMRRANNVLFENVRLGPWIHVSSEVTHLGLLRDGDALETRAVVTDLFERKGHRFVDLDVMIIANGDRPVMRAAHRAIYEVRRADA